MKLRAVIWTVVGIVVVVLTLFILLTGRAGRSKRITLQDLKRQASRSEKTINKLYTEINQAKAVPLTPMQSQLLTEAENNLKKAEELLNRVREGTEVAAVNKNLQEVHDLIGKTRRIIRRATKPK